ncbi:MAG: DUF2914 domain-containing protein [Patescibacteria group bacterium]
MAFSYIKSFYSKYEGRIGAATILLGFIFDNLTLRGATITTQTTVFTIYLILSCVAILTLNIIESRAAPNTDTKLHFWAFILLQFSIGSLFSMFFVFYSRGFSIAATWPFLLLLLANMIGSELYKKKYSRLSVQISLLFVSIFSFCIYFLPVAVHRISGWIFAASGILSFVLVYLFVKLLARVAKKRVEEDKRGIIIGVGAVYAIINIFYIFNVIPPVPLVLKDGGIYHSIVWQADRYLAEGEEKSFSNFFTFYPLYHHTSGEPVYAVAAVYAPAALETTIVHDWQYFDKAKSKWQSVTIVPVAIVGGREGGYRSYSVKQNVVPGLWRVDIKTSSGKIIGRIKFEIVEDGTAPNLVEDIY